MLCLAITLDIGIPGTKILARDLGIPGEKTCLGINH